MSQPLTFVTLVADREAFNELQAGLSATSRARLIAECESPEQLQATIKRLHPSAAIILIGAANPAQEAALIKKVAESSPATAIITTARDASPTVMMNSLRAGARDFLPLPVNAEELVTILDRAEEFCSAQSMARRPSGRVVSVFSSKGGSGVSFLASNLAAAMGVPTLLADLNLQAGDADSLLGLEAKYSITDLVKNLARLDDSLIASYVTPHSTNLALLAAPTEPHEAEDVQPEAVAEIVHVLRQRYPCVVLDLQHTFDPITVAAMDQSDDIMVVLTLDIPGIRGTRRALKVFDRIGYPRSKVHVLVNRWSKQVDVEIQKVEHHLGERIIGFVPNDYRKVMDSINLGRPLVQSEPASKISAEIKRIATVIMGRDVSAARPRRGLLRSMFNRQNQSLTLELETPFNEA